MIKAMNLTPAEVCQLSKSAYGLIDAPYLWFQEIDKALRELSFQPSPFDPTVYLLFPEGSTEPAGIIGLHVDDGLCGGNEFFLEQLRKLEKRYPFGSKKNQSFVFTGIEMHQNADFSIQLSQEKYVSKIEPIHISAERRKETETPVTKDEQQGLRRSHPKVEEKSRSFGVVVPGACYLEMIVAGCTTFLGNEAWCVENLGFAKPLVLRLLPDGSLEEPTELRLVIRPDGRLEVESEIGSDPEDSIVSVHVEATLVTKSGGWSNNRPEQDSFNLDKLREQCPESVDIDLMYSFGRKSGLPLQPRFRTVRHVQKGDQESFGRLEMERDGTQQGFWLGPSLIDGSFQASMALADAAVGIGTLKIPLSIRRLQPCGRKYSIAVWSYFQLIDFTDKSTVFRSWLLNDAGEALLYFDHVHLQEVRDEHIQKVLQASGRQGAEQQMLYDVLWRESELSSQASGSQLLLGSQAALRQLDAKGLRSEEMPMEEEALRQLLQSETWSTVILADGLLTSSAWSSKPASNALPGGERSDVAVLNRAMLLTKVIAKMGAKAPLLIFPTWGAQPLASEDAAQRRAGLPDHSGLWGFARAVRMEYPGTLRVTCVDLDASKEASAWSQLAEALPALGNEEELALRGAEAKTARLARSAVKYTGALRLNMPARGSLTGLRCVPQADTAKTATPAPTAAQLRIRAVGLNFRDVLNVMGLYPGDPGPPGADCGATVLGLGDSVKHLNLADDVFGESPGCLSTYNTSSAALLTQKPSTWSYEEACCMPVIFVTVEEALGDLAKLKPKERVLIHAAAGGVGLVAIQYAKFIGAEVYATAGAEEKHEFLRSLGVKYITSSRNGNKFEEDMKNFLKEQGVDGIDVVLNSLSHDDYIGRSLALLKPGGRFVEIGKRGIWSHQQMFEARSSPQIGLACCGCSPLVPCVQ
eukprot:s784_g6.t1